MYDSAHHIVIHHRRCPPLSDKLLRVMNEDTECQSRSGHSGVCDCLQWTRGSIGDQAFVVHRLLCLFCVVMITVVVIVGVLITSLMSSVLAQAWEDEGDDDDDDDRRSFIRLLIHTRFCLQRHHRRSPLSVFRIILLDSCSLLSRLRG